MDDDDGRTDRFSLANIDLDKLWLEGLNLADFSCDSTKISNITD